MTVSSKPVYRLAGLHPSVYALFFAIVLLLGAAVYRITLGPYPNHWDDAMYAVSTFRWLDFIEDRGLLPGLFWGWFYRIPLAYPPMVFLTSLLGGLIGETIVAMRIVQLVWFAVMLLAVYGIGRQLAGRWAGVLAAIVVGTMPHIFFWSQMIMGEPSLFASVAIFLLLLIRWRDELTLRRGAAIGFVIGFGTLTKQHFLVLAIGPLCIWAIWVGRKFVHDSKQRKQTALSLLLVVVVATVTAGLWYARALPAMIKYATEPFVPLTLGPAISWSTIGEWFRILLEQLGWPAALLTLFGVVWACYRLVRMNSKQLHSTGNVTGPLWLLFSSGLIGLIAAAMTITTNTRFFAPVLVPWGILAGLALDSLWRQGRFISRALILIGLTLQVALWWNQVFAPVLPGSPIFLPRESLMRPANVEPLPEALQLLETQLEPSSEAKVWLVGGTDRFNPPMVAALVAERGHEWQAKELYHWDEQNLETILNRLNQGRWVLVHESIDGSGKWLVTRFDSDVLQWLKSHTDTFELVYKLEAPSANNRIWMFRNLYG